MKRAEVKKLMVESLRLAEECKEEARTSSATADGVMTAIIAVGIFKVFCRVPRSEFDSPVVFDKSGGSEEVNNKKPEHNLPKNGGDQTHEHGFPPRGLGIW